MSFMSYEDVHELLEESDVAHENANKNADLYHVGRDKRAGLIAKMMARYHMSVDVFEAHEAGEIHYHDTDYAPDLPMTNCSLPNYPDMLANGFKIGDFTLETPKSVEVACSQIEKIIVAVSSAQYGGTTIEDLDIHLEPYIQASYDKHFKTAQKYRIGTAYAIYAADMTKKEVFDAVQALLYNINTTLSTQGQTPFVSIGFGFSTTRFGRWVQEALIAMHVRGLGAEARTPVFPKLLFKLARGINLDPSDPNYDIKLKAVECQAKRNYPDVLLTKGLEKQTGGIVSPMGCRAFLSPHESGYLGRMNLGVVSVNLPRISLEALTERREGAFVRVPLRFWSLLDERLALAIKALRSREARCRQAKPKNAPILYMHGGFGRLGPDDRVDSLFDNHRASLALGYVGLYEAVALFYGRDWEEDEDAQEFGRRIMEIIAQAADKANEDKMGFVVGTPGAKVVVYGTPAEALAYRFARLDREKYGAIADITDKSGNTYYTNSFHLDSRLGLKEGWDPFSKLGWESQFRVYSKGGFTHVSEWPDHVTPETVENFWDWAYEMDIPYMGVNFPIDKCLVCLWHGDMPHTGEKYSCLNCGNDDPLLLDVIRRVSGYMSSPALRPVVKGRQQEFNNRAKHA